MKRIVILSLLVLFFGSVKAQTLKDSDVPKAVLKTFSSKFSSVEGTEWTKINSDFEAKMLIDSNTVVATYDDKGNWIQTSTTQAFSNLPIAVIVAVATKLEGQRISDSFKLEKAVGKLTYRVVVNDIEYVLDEGGNILTKAGKEYHEEQK